MWFLRIHCGQQTQCIYDIIFGHEVMSEFYSLPQLPICFSIQLISPDEDCAVFIAGAEDGTICWNSLIGLNLNNVAHFHIPTQNVPSPRLLYQGVNLIICFAVPSFSIEIIVGLFEQSKAEDEDQGGHIGEEEAHFEHVNELTECDD